MPAVEDLHPLPILVESLLYVASKLGWANGLHRFVSACPAGISIHIFSPLALPVGIFYLEKPERAYPGA